MSLLTSLFRLVGPTLPAGWCPSTYQELADGLINGTQVTFLIDSGNFLYNYGSATPAPENRIYPWLYTPNGRWYTFQFGMWVAPVDPAELVDDFVKLWVPTAGTPESDLWSLDEGDGTDPSVPGNVTSTTGAMWQVFSTLAGRFPLGVGTIPDSDLGGGDASVGISQTGDTFGRQGEYAHQLTGAEGAVDQHTHPFGLSNNAAGPNGDDAYFAQQGTTTVTGYNGTYITGSNGVIQAPLTQADLYTLKANNNAGVTSTKHQNMPPFLGVYFIKHTARTFYTLPA